MRKSLLRGAVVLALVLAPVPAEAAPPHRAPATDATWFNDAGSPGADPHVLFDRASGYYYAYSTEGADPGHHFGVYRSPDLATWEHLPGGALREGQDGNWAHDWFWAPEVYHNPATGLYFLFYSGRMNTRVAENFRYADFEEPSKVGVAVADSPAGPFRDIVEAPLDYFPYDPDYHDVNLIMDAEQKKPPATQEEGRTAPLGTYIPFIDPDVFFDADGRIYLYFSRNAYRNWVWDDALGKYVEESNIYAVELTGDWWSDPTGRTVPSIAPAYRNANLAPEDPPGTRKDGYVPILNHGADPQEWENAHVDDYARSGGAKKDRRWAEGSTTIRTTDAQGRPLYLLTYSANNYENEFYGVGYATASSPLGPWRKSPDNPVLAQDPAKGLYSTGHGSIAASPDGAEQYYVHHGRPSTTAGRALYTSRFLLDDGNLAIESSTTDEPMPSGVGPITPVADQRVLRTAAGRPVTTTVRVHSAPGAAFDLTNPLNRVRAEVRPAGAATVTVSGGEVTVTPHRRGVSRVTITYQRQRADGSYTDVANTRHHHETPAAVTVGLVVR
ncbi:glycoside hydrolase family 43 protein [Umezawaea beigongshangensis]|uniref:glycoside hydrolase family 43 protein n=1 Tax=Umezawaea beigongshangensis TaxID=2780383 RepID=UPI0018F20B0A|nr:glycoside hydrolase family 43 protein [Umezawaea beigongshangensis]